MLPVESYLDARRTARFHVRVRLCDVDLPAVLPGMARVEAEVLTIFRADGRLRPGGRISFDVPVYDNPDVLDPGPEIYLPVATLSTERVFEAFLNGDPPECSLAMWQFEAIEPL